MLNKETIKQIALDNGFKLKEQVNGEMDLNPYVYDTVNAIIKVYESKNNHGWISIDDPPTTSDFVFVLLHGRFPALGKYSNDIWEAQALGSQVLNLVDGTRVTHWLPSPQPPEEEADDQRTQ